MIGLLVSLMQLIVIGCLSLLAGWAVSEWIREEVGSQIDQKLELEIRRSRATHEIKDELRRSSRLLVEAALEPPDGHRHISDDGSAS